jgi:hypothetical protein
MLVLAVISPPQTVKGPIPAFKQTQHIDFQTNRLVSITALGIDGSSGKLDFGINFFLGDGMAFNAGP